MRDGADGPLRAGAPQLDVRDDPEDFTNSGVGQGPVLPWLGDVMATPVWLPFRNVISGDIVVLAGAAVLLHVVCRLRLSTLVPHLRARSSCVVGPTAVEPTGPRHGSDQCHSCADGLGLGGSTATAGDDAQDDVRPAAALRHRTRALDPPRRGHRWSPRAVPLLRRAPVQLVGPFGPTRGPG